MTDPTRPPGFWTARRIASALGLAAFLAVLATLNDPGITSDEPLDVRVGRRYVEAILRAKPKLDRSGVIALFGDNAQHPPLGRLLVGLASEVGEPFEALLGEPDPFSVRSGRLAPALTFGVLVWVIAITAGRRSGPPGALTSGLAVLMMPRLFSHAHFATLDTILCLFWVGSVLAVESAAASRRPWLGMVLAGLVWGLALLTKIHAWLLPPLLLAWMLWRLGWKRGIPAALLWIVVGLAVFIVGWPWLWFETAARLQAFLATSVERQALRVQYFGTVYLDRDVPWHYPWIYFAVTVPVGLHLLGGVGLWDGLRVRCQAASTVLYTGAIVLLLAVFSTRAPVYDGERLFLPAFFLWAILIGRGFATIWITRRSVWLRSALAATFAVQIYGVLALHPFGLSYYNALIGGLSGAERCGMELTYWGDAVDPVLLDRLARQARPDQTVALIPTLHHIQPTAFMTQGLMNKRINLVDENSADRADWLIVYRRQAYWPKAFATNDLSRKPFAVRTRQGVWLSGVWAGRASPPEANLPSSRGIDFPIRD